MRISKKITSILLTVLLLCSAVTVSVQATAESDTKRIGEGETAQFRLTAPENASYSLTFTYRTVPGRQISPEAELTLTGNGLTFEQHVEFTRKWCDEHTEDRFRTDRYGNEITPQAAECDERQTMTCGISAKTGEQPTVLPAGSYTLTVTGVCETVEIFSAELTVRSLPTYQEYLNAQTGEKENSGETLRIEAELMSAKSDSSIIPSYDRSSPSISPNRADRISLNIMGGGCYSKANQWAEWEVEVKKSGFYAIDVRYQQDGLRGIGVGRRILIDGEVPFAEFDTVQFPYAQNYRTLRLSDGQGQPYLVYLKRGSHTLRMQVTLALLEQEILDLQDYIASCNEMYRKIISITGASPDVYRDYYLDTELPELMPFLKDSALRLEDIATRIERYTEDDAGSETTVIRDMLRVVNRFLDKPYQIPADLDDFTNNVDSLADMVVTLQTQSLTLDYLTLTAEGGKLDPGNSNFFSYLLFRTRVFLHSFVGEYVVSSGDGDEESSLKVWVNMGSLLVGGAASGRDQMQIIKRLCDDSFSEQQKIGVNFSLVSAGDTLMQAILAGKGPDAALFVAEQTVANLALRGVLSDISQMEDFSSCEEQFYPSALIPFTFDGGIYALPETQGFNMMFCRTDIFARLGLSAPETWEDFYAVEKVLAQSKLEIGIGESQDIFEMMLLQRGGRIYNDGLTASDLKCQTAVDAFGQWTDLYVKHGLPLVFSFFNRFRTGEMPIGIMSYLMYNQLTVAAPEIEGLWEMYPVPGIRGEDGTVNRAESSTNNGCIVIAGSRHLDDTLAFVRWWTDAETQLRFGRQVETLLGKSARYNTANRAAFDQLNWSAAERKQIATARESVTDIPQTVATYYVSRCISNAFRRVVYSYENTRDVLYRYSDDIDRELERKYKVLHMDGK